jgi:gas vesicle protein
VNEGRYRGFGQTTDAGTAATAAGAGAGLGITLLLLGLGIGAVTALLLAPDAGRKTRKRLRRRYEDARETLGDWTDNASDAWDRGSDWTAEKRKVMNKRVKPIRKSIFG